VRNANDKNQKTKKNENKNKNQKILEKNTKIPHETLHEKIQSKKSTESEFELSMLMYT